MTERYTLYHGDCLDILPTLPRDCVVITDLPYGIDGSSGTINKKRGKGNYNQYQDTRENLIKIVLPAVKFMIAHFETVILTPGNSNFSIYPQPDSFGAFYQPAAVGLQTFGNLDAQPIFYYGKNATKKNMGKSCSFVMTSKADDSSHPCRKPTKEWRDLIFNHTLPGQTIVDPFMGSGTTGEIAIKAGRFFAGMEIDDLYFMEAETRIKNAAGEFVLTEKEKQTGQLALFG